MDITPVDITPQDTLPKGILEELTRTLDYRVVEKIKEQATKDVINIVYGNKKHITDS